MQFLNDPNGKPSAMRTASLACIAAGLAMLLGTTFGFSPAGVDTTQEALWLIGIAFGGKAVQRTSEAKG